MLSDAVVRTADISMVADLAPVSIATAMLLSRYSNR
jgi:hypothetical protein